MKNKNTYIMLCLLSIQTATIAASSRTPAGGGGVNSKQAEMAFNTAHTGFIKNAGQVYDYNKQVTPDVFYSLHTKAVSVFLTPKGLTYSIVQRELANVETDLIFNNKSNFTVIDKKVARVDMCLIDANIKADNIIELSYINDVFVNFYGSTMNTSALNLKQCNQLIIKEVYPHIDWVLHVMEDESFKYDFIVHPGGNASSIKYKFIGAKNIIANNSADVITIETPLGKLTEGALYCFTSGNDKQIHATYTLVDDCVSLNISVYDKSETLIIDPAVMVLTWATFYGGSSAIGSGATFCRAIKTDSVNNRVYIVGECFSSPFPNLNNNVAYFFSPSVGGSSPEAFITAFDLTGKQKWATYYLSTEPDEAFDVEVDGNGNIYMVGSTESHNAPGGINFLTTQYQGGFIQTTNNAKPIVPGIYSYQEGFIVRFNTLGQLQWATLLGGDRYDVLHSVTCDKNNNIYVCGVTDSQSKLPTNKQGNGYYAALPGSVAPVGFIASFKSQTSKSWCTYFGTGATGAGCYDMVCDAANNLYVVGQIGSSTTGFPFYNPGNGAFFSNETGSYLAVFSPSSNQKWCTSFKVGQQLRSVDINHADGTILVGGYTTAGSLFPWQNVPVPNSTFFDNTFNGGTFDGFVALLNTNYSIYYATILGGNGDEIIQKVAISNTGRIFVSGETNTINSPAGTFPTVNTSASAYFESNLFTGKESDIIISYFEAKTSATPLKLAWSTLFGDDNNGREFVEDIDISDKFLFLTGYTFLEPVTPSFPLICEVGGFLQYNSNPVVAGFNQSGSNGLILKFMNEEGSNLRAGATTDKYEMVVFPNPSDGNFIYLKSGISDKQQVTIEITDLFGRCLKNIGKIELSGNASKIDLGELSEGYYFLKIETPVLRKLVPFIKSK